MSCATKEQIVCNLDKTLPVLRRDTESIAGVGPPYADEAHWHRLTKNLWTVIEIQQRLLKDKPPPERKVEG